MSAVETGGLEHLFEHARHYVHELKSQAAGSKSLSGRWAGYKWNHVRRPLYPYADGYYPVTHAHAYAMYLRDRDVRIEPGSHDERLWACRLLHAIGAVELKPYWGSVRPADVVAIGKGGTTLRQEDVDRVWEDWELLWRCAIQADLERQTWEMVALNIEYEDLVPLPADMTLTRYRVMDWLGLSEKKSRIWPRAMMDAGVIRVSRREATRRSSIPATYYTPC